MKNKLVQLKHSLLFSILLFYMLGLFNFKIYRYFIRKYGVHGKLKHFLFLEKYRLKQLKIYQYLCWELGLYSKLTNDQSVIYYWCARLFMSKKIENWPDVKHCFKKCSDFEKEQFVKALIKYNPDTAITFCHQMAYQNDTIQLFSLLLNKTDTLSDNTCLQDDYLLQYQLLLNTNFWSALNCLHYYFRINELYPVFPVNTEKPIFIDNLCCDMVSTGNHAIEQKLVTVIICAHNLASLVQYAIKSIFNQTYQYLEVILIDDGSIDSTFQKMHAMVVQYPSIRKKLIAIKENVGPMEARNIGLHYATGDLITFHDADDWAHPQRIQFQVEAIQKKNKLASITKMVRIKNDGGFFNRSGYPLHHNAMISLMFERQVFRCLGFFFENMLGADAEYFERIKLLYGENSVAVINKVLIFAAYRPGSRMTAPETGTEKYGYNQRRVNDWETLRHQHIAMLKGKQTYYIEHQNTFEYDAYL